MDCPPGQLKLLRLISVLWPGVTFRTGFINANVLLTKWHIICLFYTDLYLCWQCLILKGITVLVLATDMARHGEIMDNFKCKLEPEFDYKNKDSLDTVIEPCTSFLWLVCSLILSLNGHCFNMLYGSLPTCNKLLFLYCVRTEMTIYRCLSQCLYKLHKLVVKIMYVRGH